LRRIRLHDPPSLLANASFENVTAANNLAENGQQTRVRSGRRAVFHTMHTTTVLLSGRTKVWPKCKEPHRRQGSAQVRLYDSAIQLLKSSDRSSLASGMLNAGTKLHGNVLNFSAARTKSNGSDDGCDDDSALHISLLMVAPKSLY
jgi:hypothetical protein